MNRRHFLKVCGAALALAVPVAQPTTPDWVVAVRQEFVASRSVWIPDVLANLQVGQVFSCPGGAWRKTAIDTLQEGGPVAEAMWQVRPASEVAFRPKEEMVFGYQSVLHKPIVSDELTVPVEGGPVPLKQNVDTARTADEIIDPHLSPIGVVAIDASESVDAEQNVIGRRRDSER